MKYYKKTCTNKVNDKIYKTVCAKEKIGENITLNNMFCGLALITF